MIKILSKFKVTIFSNNRYCKMSKFLQANIARDMINKETCFLWKQKGFKNPLLFEHYN